MVERVARSRGSGFGFLFAGEEPHDGKGRRGEVEWVWTSSVSVSVRGWLRWIGMRAEASDQSINCPPSWWSEGID